MAQNVAVIDAHKRGALPPVDTIKIGPPLVFEPLWRESKIKDVLGELLKGGKYEFPVERAIFMTVLHRLMVSGSDRAAEVWCRGYKIDGIADLELHHLYRAVASLGEELRDDQQAGATPFGTPNRPIFHKCDETICGHVFCSFLALVLFQELQLKLVERGWSVEWARLKDDLDALEDVTVKCAGQPFIVRSQPRGDAGKALQAVGVALGPTVRAAQNNRTQA